MFSFIAETPDFIMTLTKKLYFMWIGHVCPRPHLLNKFCIGHDTDPVDWIGAHVHTYQSNPRITHTVRI